MSEKNNMPLMIKALKMIKKQLKQLKYNEYSDTGVQLCAIYCNGVMHSL